MTTAFQQSAFQWTPNKAFQIDAEAGKTGTGGIDPGEGLRRRRYPPVKPTGLPPIGRKPTKLDERTVEVQRLHAETLARTKQEIEDEAAKQTLPIQIGTPATMDVALSGVMRGVREGLVAPAAQQLTEEEQFIVLLLISE